MCSEQRELRNLRLTLAFFGKPFVGWQVQKNGISVMEKVQDAIEKVTGFRSDVKGCSRTDSGVHAHAYVLSFRTSSQISTEKFPIALNQHLPHEIVVKDCKEVLPDFHARYDSLGKEYLYLVHTSPKRDPFRVDRILEFPRPLDFSKMADAACHFVGEKDFLAFCGAKNKMENTVRTVWWVEMEKKGEEILFYVAGDGFLFNMVRIMVGTLLYVGRGQLEPDDIPLILESRDRLKAGMTAPARGLYLNRVFYEAAEVKRIGENS